MLTTMDPACLSRLRLELEEAKVEIQDSHEARLAREEEKMVKVIKEAPGAFYGYAQKFSKLPAQVGPLELADGSLTTDESLMAEALRVQYDSVFLEPRVPLTEDYIGEIFPQEDPQVPTDLNSRLSHISFTSEGVQAALAALSNSAAPGPDGIPTRCLKLGGPFMVQALLDIYQSSMDSGVVDQTMKVALISPIWKGGIGHSQCPIAQWP